MQPIQSLLDEASRLSKSFHHWNNLYMYCVFATAVLIAVTFIAQWKAKGQAEALELANNSVIQAKDEQLREEFTHRDERIAQVKGEADVRIAQVESDGRAEAKRIEGNAKKDIEAAKLETAKLKEKNLETESRLEKERNQRVELEKSIAPRWLVKYSASDVAPLRKFAG